MSLSLDLRQRILSAYKNKEGSIRVLAKRFCVGSASVWRLVNRYEKAGELAPISPPGRTRTLDKKSLSTLVKILREFNDATLLELCVEFKKRTSIQISKTTMDRYCQRLGMRYKKKFISS